MQIETIDRIARLVPTVSALLAGFSFTMIRGLMFHAEKPRLTAAALISFIAAAAAMLVVTFNATYVLINIAASSGEAKAGNAETPIAEGIIHLTKWTFYGGVICLFAGGGLLGWLQSKRVGLVGAVIMFGAACIILRTILLLGTKL